MYLVTKVLVSNIAEKYVKKVSPILAPVLENYCRCYWYSKTNTAILTTLLVSNRITWIDRILRFRIAQTMTKMRSLMLMLLSMIGLPGVRFSPNCPVFLGKCPVIIFCQTEQCNVRFLAKYYQLTNAQSHFLFRRGIL